MNKTIDQLTEKTTLNENDEFVVFDPDDGVSKKLKAKNFSIPFPDYERGSLYTTQATSYTLTEDCWVQYAYSFTPTTDTASILINGQNCCSSDYWSNAGVSIFSGFVKKGSVITRINNQTISTNALKVFGLK